MSAPEAGCPAWCENHEPAGLIGKIQVKAMHAAHRWRGPVPVALMQSEDGQPYLSFDTTDVSLRDAPGLADTMRRLGHPDTESAIRELAALATAPDDDPETEGSRLAERDAYIGTWSNQDVTRREES